jgi:hypothetical protein
MKPVPVIVALALAAPAMSQNSTTPDPTKTMDKTSSAPAAAAPAYPVCTTKVTDSCVEQRAARKAPARKAAPNQIVRKDKVHRRKG